MKPSLRISLLLISVWSAQFINAQYCTPSLTTTGIHVSFAGFGPPYGNIAGGANYNTGALFTSEGYANRSAVSSGVVSRNCSNNYYVGIQSCGNQGPKNFNFRMYIDWNQDNDFDDAGEIAYQFSNNIISGNCAFYTAIGNITVPATANSGNIRMRWALREGGGIAEACGGYTGEIEDYTIIIPPNTAPVLDNSGTPLLNPLTETQTSNSGTKISRLLLTTQPAATLITEADACASKKAIAITGAAGTDGVWQYKLAAGTWTNIVGAAESNALLLTDADYIRFVPAGPGTATISFRAWDKTVSTAGQYYNISSTGGTTAFSSASETAGITIYSTASTAADIPVYMPAYGGISSNVVTTSLNPATGIFKHFDPLTTDNTSGFGYDLALDNANSKLYWIGGSTYTDLMRSNTDGTGVESLISGVFSYATGIALGANKIFITDYGAAIYTTNPDGTDLTPITGGPGQATDIGDLGDIEYYGGKIYYINQPGYAGGFKIFQANPDGTGTVELLTLDYYPNGLDVINGMLYWTEGNGANTYLRSRSISGGSVVTLATAAGRSFLDPFVSPANNKIYFVDGSMTAIDDYLDAVPITGGAITRQLVLEDSYFALAFSRNFGTLPVDFVTVKAWQQGNHDIVEWNIAAQENVSHYEVERSADGRNFTATGSVAAGATSRYQWTDVQPLSGNNYYRIRSVDNDGKQLYSAVVLVNRGQEAKSIAVYPTVVSSHQFTLRMSNSAAGVYQLRVVNYAGQQIHTQRIVHSGGSIVQSISLPAASQKGIYRVTVTGGNQSLSAPIVVQ
jgi:hypothetical protein